MKKLIASSNSLETLTKMVNQYFYSSTYVLNENGTISNINGPRLGIGWELKKGRYRFIRTGVIF